MCAYLKSMDCRVVRNASGAARAVAPTGPMLLELHCRQEDGEDKVGKEKEGS